MAYLWFSPYFCRMRLLLAIATTVLAIACNPSPQTIYSASCRPITHVMGEACVPFEPQRVVTLSLLGNVLSLGIQPVGAVEWGSEVEQFPEYLKSYTTGITYLGLGGQPSLEKITQLQPDLILSSEADRDIYRHLSQIAPTVLIAGRSTGTWKEQLQQLGVVLGKSEQANELLADYEQQVKSLQQQIGVDRLSSLVVSFVRVDLNQIQLPLRQLFASTILQDVGITRPSNQSKDGFYETVSFEKLPEIDADVILVMPGWQERDRPNLVDRLNSHPLWLQLDAVQHGRVYQVPDYWIAGDIIAAQLVLNDLRQYLIENKSKRSHRK